MVKTQILIVATFLIPISVVVIFCCYISGYFTPYVDTEIESRSNYKECRKEYDAKLYVWYKGEIIYYKFQYNTNKPEAEQFIKNYTDSANVFIKRIKDCKL